MNRGRKVLALVIALVAAMIFIRCDFGGGDGVEMVSDETRAIDVLLGAVEILDSSWLLVAGPVAPGSLLVENNLPDEAVQLQVPEADGEYYVFIIDDEPGAMFEHPVRFAWVNPATAEVGWVDASYWMTIFPPDQNPEPFVQRDAYEYEGLTVFSLDGHGAPEAVDAGRKARAGEIDGQDTAARDGGRKPVKEAFVLDAGDAKTVKGDLVDKDKKNTKSIAEGIDKYNATPIAEWVGDNGFDVKRTSQYWGNDLNYLDASSVNHFLGIIRSYGRYFKGLGPPDSGCDEFFLYITGHGNKAGAFNLYVYDGSGDFTRVSYSHILRELLNFPSHVKVTIFSDCCYSGTAISRNKTLIEQVCARICALTIITSTAAKLEAWAPDRVWDSATEDFMEGDDVDLDHDGRKGDIRDRFETMKNAYFNKKPQSYHCPEGGSWCSLDGPVVEETACADFSGTYMLAVDGIVDPRGHKKYVGDPFDDPVRVAIAGSTISVNGSFPFVGVSGPINDDCSFTATGMGTVAGYSNISVEMNGEFYEGSYHLSGSYEMGTRWKLPGGKSITFHVSGSQ